MPPEDPPQIRITPTPRRPAATARTNKNWLWIGSAVVSALIAGGVVVSLLLKTGDSTPHVPAPAPASTATPIEPPAASTAQSEDAAASSEQIVDDPAGELLWASPTNGTPLSLAYVPAGTQCLLALRPAAIASHPEGERVLASLGPWGKSALDRLRAILGAEPQEVNSLLIAIVVGGDGQLEASYRAEMVPSWDDEELARRFPQSEKREAGDRVYRVVDERAYFLTTTPSPALVVSPASLAEELIDSGGEAPPLVRDVETLAAHSDADRDATLIVAPKFLAAGGNDLLTADAAPLHDALQWLVGTDATAIAICADWGERFFLELQVVPALNVPPRRLAAKLRERVTALPEAIEEIVIASPWHPHGRKVLARLPGMLRTLARYTRAGEEERLAFVRSYLPAVAGHNLLMASELLLTQPRGDAPATIAAPQPPATLEERLAAKTSLTFTKASLEEALQLLGVDIGVDISIAGADLQLDGITKNQSLGLDLRDRPASEILVEILRRANPDRTATGPADPRQKLVYVVEPAANGSTGRIIVTTRTAAEKRGTSLPAPFAVAGE